jgi:hypothetical protein
MAKKQKYREIHGQTRVGKFLQKVGNSDLVEIATSVATGDVFDTLKDLIGLDSKMTMALKLLEMDISLDKEVTQRFNTDMRSDNWLSKNIRPILLVFLTVAAVFLAVADSVQWIDFRVQNKWSDMLQVLLVTAYSFYFGGRSFEKLKTKF